MDVFTFILLAVTIVFTIIGITSYFETKVKAGSQVTEKQFQEISDKLDIALSRIETLERLATDENEALKRRFKDIKKSA
ncbi:hypothetical protein [Hirschia maritima]|uniref:hypothetical protein n=1 Tax=Hirschia maritima TaxID=1121961 RepID=UPI0003689D0A|nr:hypothetical protein [Hirschia maritima]